MILAIISGFSVYSQVKNDRKAITDLFTKSQKVYVNAENFKFSTAYKLFNTYKSTTVAEKYEGIVFKQKDDFYSKIGTTEFVKLNEDYIKIDHASKLMQIGKVDREDAGSQSYDLTALLSNFTVFELTETADYFICKLTAPAITFVPYSKVIVYINKKSYMMSKQILYMLKKINYKDAKGQIQESFPRLEIAFSDFQTQNIEWGTKFSQKSYIAKKNNKTVPSNNYKDYKIVD